ncbi:unnamed protein product [Penicillium camemberti]|uniref:Str. FM013 n=1 Tax=Penicillium camemberti (strain FM 013) TaxID=1429867 RepID=A0A0G4PNB7_PENC3|nr:unnamed protein product [Penicillium camemberti]
MVFKRRSKKWEVIEEWRKEEKWEWRGTAAAQSGRRVKESWDLEYGYPTQTESTLRIEPAGWQIWQLCCDPLKQGRGYPRMFEVHPH